MNKIKKLNKTGRVTLVIITAFFLIFFLLTAFMYVELAVTGQKKGYNLYEKMFDLYVDSDYIQGKRGNIFDRDGLPLAQQITSYTMSANLYEKYGETVTDIKYTAHMLSTVLNMSEDEIAAILSKDAKVVEFGRAGRELTFTDKEAIEKMKLSGISFQENVQRFYPNGEFASHTLGFTQADESENRLVGKMGVELYFDEMLQGTTGKIEYLRDRKGNLLPNHKIHVIQEALDGFDVYLTMKTDIQTILENAMNEVWAGVNPESIVAIVANPKTGEILAMGNRSTFNPNIRDIENFNNPLISEPFEPGSTLKIYTYAAAINEGKYQGDLSYNSGKRILSNGVTIKDWDTKWGTITYNEGFYRSSNTGIVDILQNWVEPDTFLNYLQAFGFGHEVGIELSGENKGSLPLNSDTMQKITAGYGQGILTTPIQHIQAITAILNEGQLIRPQLVSKVVDSKTDEMISEFEIIKMESPISAKTAQMVKELMVGVVDNKIGSGYRLYDLDGITSGGKTGTAQIADGHKGYIANEYVYNYIGFAPADDPELVMYLAMSKPQKGTGHSDLAKIYKFVMEYTLNSLGTNTQQTNQRKIEDAIATVETPSVINQKVSDGMKILEDAGLTPIIIGENEQIFAQYPQSHTLSVQGNKVFIQTGGTVTIPDFMGWSKADVSRYRDCVDFEVEIHGEGSVVDQSLGPGMLMVEGDCLKITLGNK